MPLTSPVWYVLCIGDDDATGLATRRPFASHASAWDYADTVSPARHPIVVVTCKRPTKEATS